MKIEIESTENLTHIDGVQVRAWKGKTGGGIDCIVFVYRIAVAEGKDCAQFDAELKEQLQPGRDIDLRHIL